MVDKPMSKQSLYSMVSSHSKNVVKRLIDLTDSKNENIALGACKVLINKVLPNAESARVFDSPKDMKIEFIEADEFFK